MGSTLLTAFIVLGITFIFIFLFSFLHKRGKKKEATKRKSILDEIIANNQLQITDKEELAHSFIAIDAAKGKLIFVNYYNSDIETEVIHLHEIKSAKAEIEENIIYDDRNGRQVVSERQFTKIHLELLPKNVNGKNYSLPFYLVLYNSIDEQNNLKTRAQHWQNIINNYIKTVKKDYITIT